VRLEPTYKLLQGDVLDRLRELPDESVHCVVTSPPYWGLRDYGTASWQGGDSDCNHRTGGQVNQTKDRGTGRDGVYSSGVRPGSDSSTCSDCGAKRIDQQIGLEATPQEFVAKLVSVFREVRRVLRKDGTAWVNMGDSYAGYHGNKNSPIPTSATNGWTNGTNENMRGDRRPQDIGLKPKDLCGIPWRLAFALQDDGWWLRQDLIWSKPNPMPESVTDRCTKAHEYIFLLTKSARYYYDAEAIKEPAIYAGDLKTTNGADGMLRTDGRTREGFQRGVIVPETRNKRSVWEITTEPYAEAHFATFPTKLVEPCILAGTSEKGCCEICGASWERIVEKTGGTTGTSWHNHENDMARGMRGGDGGTNTAAAGMKDYKVQTLGWQPSCMCGPITTNCTVLDPFNGSGTTGIVALANRCHYIGIDLNPEYLAMAERRLQAATAQGILL
jgi:DNA modification methylase